MFLKLGRSWFTASRFYLAFPVGIFEIPLASLRRSQSTNIVVKGSPIPLYSEEAACKEGYELEAASPWKINCQILCYTHSPQGCGSIIISLLWVKPSLLLEQDHGIWTSGLFLCFFVLCGCDFLLAHFWCVRVTSSAEYMRQCSLERNLGRLWSPKQNCLLFSVSFFFSKCYRK